eukprot:SAG31_NODE_793_length_12044_cov_12.886229_11_plen_94_part_00
MSTAVRQYDTAAVPRYACVRGVPQWVRTGTAVHHPRPAVGAAAFYLPKQYSCKGIRTRFSTIVRDEYSYAIVYIQYIIYDTLRRTHLSMPSAI